MVSTTGTQRKSTTRIQAVKMFNDNSPVVSATGTKENPQQQQQQQQ